MSNFFDLRRFGKYLLYDVKTAFADCRASLLVMSLIPVIWFTVTQLVSLVTTGGFAHIDEGIKMPVFVAVVIICVISFPVRHYGQLTDRRRGSDWLMIPASGFEKFLSLLLVCCVLLPLCLSSVYLLCDYLMSFVPRYGAVTFTLRDAFSLKSMGDSEIVLGVVPVVVGWLNWCENILVFALGALVFKKAKVPYTILSVFGIIFVLVAGIGLLIDNHVFESDACNMLEGMTAERFAVIINVLANGLYLLVFTLLNLGLYFRIKAIKH